VKSPPSPDAPLVVTVDDDKVLTKLIAMALGRKGYRVVEINDPTAVLEQLRELKPALVILDLVMPARDGLQVLADLRQDSELKDLPVIVATAREAEYGVRAEALGATYLRKPFEVKTLLDLVPEVTGAAPGGA
jgi:two-component system sensor histidine kinase ChiS